MKISELAADFAGRHPEAEVIVVEGDDGIMIESVVTESNEKVVILMGQSSRSKTFAEALMRGSDKPHSVKILESGEQFQVGIDGTTLQTKFETAKDAKLFVQGYAVGFSAGSGSKSSDQTA